MKIDASGGMLLLLQLAMAAVLAWSCLCRATKTNGETHREVRWAMALEGFATGLMGGAPLLPLLMPREIQAVASFFDTPWPVGHTPLAIWLLFLASILLVQLVTAKYWRAGVPRVFQLNPVIPAQPLRAVAVVTLAAVFLGFALGTSSPVAAADPGAPRYVPPGASASCTGAQGCAIVTMEWFAEVEQALKLAAQVAKQADRCSRSLGT